MATQSARLAVLELSGLPVSVYPCCCSCVQVRFDIFGNPGLMHQLPGDEVRLRNGCLP